MNRIDPITLEVLRNRFDIIAQEEYVALKKSAFSLTIKEAGDCSAAVFTRNGELISQAASLSLHFGLISSAVKLIIDAYPTRQMEEGDLFIVNDPLGGGTMHPPDIVVATPILYGEEVVALGAVLAHQIEFGGKSAGSMSPDVTEVFGQGMLLPPLYLFRKGKRNEDVVNIIRKNVRVPDQVIGDIMGEVNAVNATKMSVLRTCDEFGGKVVVEAAEELLNRAEAMSRANIAAMPDGIYEFIDYADNDGVDFSKRLKLQAKVTISGSDLSVDFTGTGPQNKGAAGNLVFSATRSAVYHAVRVCLDPSIPNNAGCWRPVKVYAPEGTFLNPVLPAAIGPMNVSQRVADVVLGAMVKALPGKLPAAMNGNIGALTFSGVDPLLPQGTYVAGDFWVGGWGARPNKDGIDVLDIAIGNCANVPAESQELEAPYRVLQFSVRPNSGGVGQYRGGCGMIKIFELLRGSGEICHRSERHTTQPWGLYGGGPAKSWYSEIVRKSGEKEIIPAKLIFPMNEGDQLHLYSGGGGGYGDPLQRDEEAVLEDVLDGKVSVESARADYGVVIDSGPTTVNHETTRKLREELARKRGAINWTFDRGEELGKE
ncbi:hydantoinase B/oxoprolinase family protein [Chloroflexota bacterium]